MCVILVGKIGEKLHRQAKKQNPDGFSLFTKSQGLIKAPTAEDVKTAVKEFGIWHYRIASSGKVDKNNIHPFPVAKGKAYLYHNGVLGAGKGEMSDTAALAELLQNASIGTVKSVLEALSSGQRFLLVSAKNPEDYCLYGAWKVESGVLMSHIMYDESKYMTTRKSVAAGWEDEEYYQEYDGKTVWGAKK